MKIKTTKTDCPVCGEPLIAKVFYEDGRMVEVDSKCTVCEYRYNWAYGYVTEETNEDR